MATKENSYDAPIYQTRGLVGGTLTGANGTTGKFAAHAAMKVKSVNVGIQTAGTSADQHYFYKVSGTATTTTTLSAVSSGATGYVQNLTSNTLALGDAFWVAKGTDATFVAGCGIEYELIPGAAVTA